TSWKTQRQSQAIVAARHEAHTDLIGFRKLLELRDVLRSDGRLLLGDNLGPEPRSRRRVRHAERRLELLLQDRRRRFGLLRNLVHPSVGVIEVRHRKHSWERG